jgi:hypothetical protein
MSSRICVTVLPEMAVLSTVATAAELSPRRRASSWSIFTRSWRVSVRSEPACDVWSGGVR